MNYSVNNVIYEMCGNNENNVMCDIKTHFPAHQIHCQPQYYYFATHLHVSILPEYSRLQSL